MTAVDDFHLLSLVMEPGDEPWRRQAACRGLDPALFYPTRGNNGTEARQVCSTCPVQGECLGYALRVETSHLRNAYNATDKCVGIWGGLSAKQRRHLRERARHV